MGTDPDPPMPAARRLEFGGEADYSEGGMNPRQLAYYRQAQSDWSVFRHFRPRSYPWWTAVRRVWGSLAGVCPFSFAPCHELHYLQMCTEKLAKAYYRADPDPRGSHAAFRRFM